MFTLYFIAEKGHYGIVKVLVEYGHANVNQTTTRGLNALYLAGTCFSNLYRPTCFCDVLMISSEDEIFSLECQIFLLSHEIFKILSDEFMRNSVEFA